MISLLGLAAGYVAAAAPFYLAFVSAYHPHYVTRAREIVEAPQKFAERVEVQLLRSAGAFFHPSSAKPAPESQPFIEPMVFQPLRTAPIAQQEKKEEVPRAVPPGVVPAKPEQAPITSVQPQGAIAPLKFELPPPPSDAAPPSAPARVVQVVDRLKSHLTADMRQHFDLFLYVSKARKGPLSQRLYVLKKDAVGNFTPLYDWPVSTGRERFEYNLAGRKVFSGTPAGFFEFDPKRMYQSYQSREWGSSMPYAMFFSFEENGAQTGVAIHAALKKNVGKLGNRASAGCIRLSPKNAKILFNLIRDNYRGAVPRFAYDVTTKTMSKSGELARDAGGNIQFADGYRALIFIENYGGAENVVAALL